jgi:hypothetical protein
MRRAELFDLQHGYEGLDAKSVPFVAIVAAVAEAADGLFGAKTVCRLGGASGFFTKVGKVTRFSTYMNECSCW